MKQVYKITNTGKISSFRTTNLIAKAFKMITSKFSNTDNIYVIKTAD